VKVDWDTDMVDWDTDMVDWDTDMVDLNRRKSRPIRSTGEFKVFLFTLKADKVLSTKLSIDDYNRFKKYTYYAYQAGIIKESETSKLLRYIVTYPFNEYGM
jgi:hypothetical protein